MKPNFALGLTDDGITLWQRGSAGWLRVGAVAIDAADLDAQMRGLAKVAAALEPSGVITKLVVPQEQMLICDLPVSARNRDMQGHEIRAQLVGRTPYPVEELDFDWTVSDGTAHVAVVARETLVEAEDFARSYGFNPVSAVAAPKDKGFEQEPFFGTTRGAREILGDLSLLERDGDILQEVGLATLPEPELVENTAPDLPEAAGSKAENVAPDGPVQNETALGTQAGSQADSADDTADPATPVSGTTDNSSEASEAPVPSASPRPQAPAGPSAPHTKSAETDAATARKAALLTKLNAAKSSSEQAAAQTPDSGKITADADRAKATPGTAGAAPAPSAASDTASDASAPDAASVAFRSRRASAPPSAPGVTDAKAARVTADITQGLRAKLAGAQNLSKRKIGGLTKTLAAVARKRSGSKTDDAAAALAAAPSGKTATDKKKSAPGKSAAALQKPKGTDAKPRKAPLETLKARAGGRATGTKATGPSASEAERMTIFGARNNDLAAETGMGRAMLILGGVAMLLLAAGIWAFFFTSRPSVAPEDTAQAELPAEIATPDPVPPTPFEITATDEDALDQPETVLSPEDDIEAALGLEDAAQQPPEDAGASELTETVERLQSEDATPAEEAPMAELEQSTGRVAGMRSSGLLPPQDSVPLPEAPAAPAPFDADALPPTRSELAQAAPDPAAGGDTESLAEQDELIDSAPEELGGEEVVEITVTEGTPPAVPPVRPGAVVDASDAVAEALQGLLADEVSEPVPAEVTQDPTTAESEPASEPAPTDAAVEQPPSEADLEIGVTQGRPPAVPPQRPEGLAPEAAEAEDAAPASAPDSPEDPTTDVGADQADLTTPPPGGVALSMLRPEARPDSVVEAAQAAVAPEAQFDASDLAVSASLRPSARPGQFSAVVQRAMRAAQPRTPAAAPGAIVAAAPAPEAPVQTARAAVSAAPPIPSSASVAREATQARAINLRQVNLIGVMGTSSNRRALVRLSNGRVVTVRVGDSLDNGRVTAISDSELRYSRRGRDVVLRIAS